MASGVALQVAQPDINPVGYFNASQQQAQQQKAMALEQKKQGLQGIYMMSAGLLRGNLEGQADPNEWEQAIDMMAQQGADPALLESLRGRPELANVMARGSAEALRYSLDERQLQFAMDKFEQELQQAAAAGPKAPQVVEIFDPETGQPQKGYMVGTEFVPLGGTKAQSAGTSLTVDPETGAVTFNQGGPARSGMPVDPTRNPSQLTKKLSDADAKLIEGYREAAVAADDLGATIDGLEMTIGNVGYTGPGGELYGKVDDLVGVLPGDSGSRGAVRSQSMEAQLSMTAKTKGAITDREMGMFKAAVPSLEQTAEGNQQIIAAMRAATNRVKTRAYFMEEYATANGSLNGAQQAWDQYMNDNPILGQNDDGSLVVFEEADWTPYLTGEPVERQERQPTNNVTEWTDYFD